MRPALRPVAPVLLAGMLAACATPPVSDGQAPRPSAVAPAPLAVEVHASPTCSCCHEWVAYLEAAGARTSTVAEVDITAYKLAHAVPQGLWSCHTAIVGGYIVEGHVPLPAIQKLLAERPPVDGIGLAGMPPGSPGMPGDKGPLAVMAFSGGTVSPFGTY